jgi:hypothetical protein
MFLGVDSPYGDGIILCDLNFFASFSIPCEKKKEIADDLMFHVRNAKEMFERDDENCEIKSWLRN